MRKAIQLGVVWLTALSLAVVLVLSARRAEAGCNEPPTATTDFPAALGSTNRPFAGPGDFVEVRVRPQVCDGNSTGFVDTDGDGRSEDDLVVTVLFVPMDGASPTHAVVAAEDLTGIDLSTTCETDLLNGGAAVPVLLNAPLDPVGLVVESPNALQFRFPDTDAQLDGPDDDRTWTGPAKLIVTRRDRPLRCDLVSLPCADLVGDTSTHGVVACIDELFELDGTCPLNALHRSVLFPHFTALPPPTNFEAMVSQPALTEVHLTTDTAGNAYFAVDWTGIFLRLQGVPIPRLVRAGTTIDSGVPPGGPVALPSDAFVSSYSPGGVLLPPVFTPLRDLEDPSQAKLFGSTDAPRTVIRVARRGCDGGQRDGLFCADDANCPGGGTCVGPLFDFTGRYLGGVGPIALAGGAGGDYTAEQDTPVPLEGLLESEATFAFVLYEALDGVPRNADADVTDFVATLRSRDSGEIQPIGQAGAEGRAVTRVRQPPFAFPAVVTDGDLLAFLEGEPLEGPPGGVCGGFPDVCDTNQNLQVSESILRVFQVDTPGEVTVPPITADASLAFDGRPLAISGGKVFFLTREESETDRATVRISVDAFGGDPDDDSNSSVVSGDARFVGFSSPATDLVTGDTNSARDVFLRDRDTDEDGVFDESGAVANLLVSLDSGGNPTNGNSFMNSLSPDGRFVAFSSAATDIVSPDANGTAQDVFVHDRDTDDDGIFDETGETSTVRVSVDTSGNQANDTSFGGQVSSDGRFVAFVSDATNLVAGDGNLARDLFVHDRDTGEDGVFDEPGDVATVRVNVDSGGADSVGGVASFTTSADGRFVAFASDAPDLVPGDGNAAFDVFVHDRDADQDGVFDEQSEPGAIATERVSVSSDGVEGNANSGGPSISADGRLVAFSGDASNLVPGDTNGFQDVFVHDRLSRETVRVSTSSSGIQGDLPSQTSITQAISADGRFVVFHSQARNLVEPLEVGSSNDVFLYDVVSGHTSRVNLDAGGTPFEGFFAKLSSDGRELVFESVALHPSGATEVYAHGLDPTDVSADRTGDSDLADTLLRVVDTTPGPPASPIDLCPADAVAVVEERAVFLRPETSGTSPGCPVGPTVAADLNDDGDELDRVVHFWDGTIVSNPVQNLVCAASDVALSDARIAALVSEADEGGAPLNGDVDAQDRVLFVRAVGDPAPATCLGSNWINTAEAGDTIGVSGDKVVLLTDEAEQGAGPLNGDGDTSDRVVRLLDGATGTLIPIVDDDGLPDAAEDFVVGERLVAFHTSEAAQGAGALNGDGIPDDDLVLQLYVLETGERINTGQAVWPCGLVACDPRVPYRVGLDTVRFLTFESDQNDDLNDDGDQDDLLVQVFNVASGESVVIGEVVDTGASLEDPRTAMNPLDAPEGEDAGESSQQVFLSQGRCVEDSGISCTVGAGSCPQGEFCLGPEGGTGTCVLDTGESCFVDKPAGQNGCPVGSTCADDFVLIAVADRDGDEQPDAADNCPDQANVDQVDSDGDGVGDICDLQTCGDGTPDVDPVTMLPLEECDDGNPTSGDGCDANCRVTACGNGIQTGSEACDDGNRIGGDGCSAGCTLEPVLGSGCSIQPIPSCREDALNVTLLVDRDLPADSDANGSRSRVVFKWVRGGATSFSEFGDPVGGGVHLCFYADANLQTQLSSEADSPNWLRIVDGKLYRYVDRSVASDGLLRVILKSDPVNDGKSKVIIVAKGAGIGQDSARPIPAFSPGTGIFGSSFQVQAQMSGGGCFGMSYDDPVVDADVFLNKDVGVFKLKRTGP